MPTLLSHDDLGVFLDGAPQWRFVHGAIRTRIQAPDFPAAIALVSTIGEVAEEMDHHPDLDIRWRNIDVGLATHSAGGITEFDTELAGRITELARQAGAELSAPSDPSARIEIGIDTMNAEAIRDFWRVGLGLTEQTNEDGAIELAGPAPTDPGVWFQPMTEPRPGRNRIHLDVYVARDAAADRVAAVQAAGGRLVTDAHAPGWWVLADAEDNELCVCVY